MKADGNSLYVLFLQNEGNCAAETVITYFLSTDFHMT